MRPKKSRLIIGLLLAGFFTSAAAAADKTETDQESQDQSAIIIKTPLSPLSNAAGGLEAIVARYNYAGGHRPVAISYLQPNEAQRNLLAKDQAGDPLHADLRSQRLG